MGVWRFFAALAIFLAFSGVCFGEDAGESEAGEIQLNIYQEYYAQEGVYVFKKEIVGVDEWFAQKGASMNAIYEGDVGSMVTYHFYFEEEYAGSCEIPYGEGECSIIVSPPEGFSMEGKKFWVSSGAGIDDVQLAIIPEDETSVNLPLVSPEYDISIYGMIVIGGPCVNGSTSKDEIGVQYYVINHGADINTNFDVDVFMDGKLMEKVRFEYITINAAIEFNTRNWKIDDPSNHSITISLDPTNNLLESNTEDNVASSSFSASATSQVGSKENKITIRPNLVLWDTCNQEWGTEMVSPEIAKYEIVEISGGLPDQNIAEPQGCEAVCENYCDENKLYSGGTCNPETGECEYSSEECKNGCDPEFARCIEMIGAINFGVFIDEGYVPGVVASGEDSITVTASLYEYGLNSVESIEGVDVRFELTGPGNQVVEGKTDSDGKIEATFVIPHWNEFFPPQEGFYYGFTTTDVEVVVSASKHDSGYDFDYSDGPYTIEVISPAISIDRISIDPNPAQAYQEHRISITTSDMYAEGPAHFAVMVPEGVLSYDGLRGEYGGGIGFESWGSPTVYWEAPERGLTPYEFDYANGLNDAGRDYGIATGSSLVGVAFPVVKQGETLYGMYGDGANILGQMKESLGSLSFEESLWRAADVGVSEVKLGIGAVNLAIGNVPGGGLGKELIEDTIGSGAEAGQVYLKQKAADARNARMETRSMDMFVEVEVRDSEGYYDRDYLIFEMDYLWEKEG